MVTPRGIIQSMVHSTNLDQQKEGALINRAVFLNRWFVVAFCALPLFACGDKETTVAPAAETPPGTVTSRSLSDMGAGAGDEAQLAVPLESLDLESTPISGQIRERRSAREVEACVEQKAGNFKGPDGEPSAPSADDLRAFIEACGA